MNPPTTPHQSTPADDEPAAAAPAIVCTVAGPRLPYSKEVYTGSDLARTSARPGAYDAFNKPSVMNGHRQEARTVTAEAWTPPKLPAPAAAGVAPAPIVLSANRKRTTPLRDLTPGPARLGDYYARPGSAPSQLIAHLKTHGGHMSYADIARRYCINVSSVTAVFKRAFTAGVLVRHLIDDRAAIALPGYVPPARTTTGPTHEEAALNAQLQDRLAKLAKVQAEIAQIQGQLARAGAAA